MKAYATDGGNHTLEEANKAFPELANAAGGRSELLNTKPWFVQQAVKDCESNWALSGVCLSSWFFLWFGATFVGSESNNGNGDVWARNEALRLGFLKLRITELYLEQQPQPVAPSNTEQ